MLDLDALRPDKPRLFTRDEFEALCEAGVFDDDHVELLRGVLVVMGERGEPHARISAWLHKELLLAVDRDAYEVRSHTSYAATVDSVPEPDVQVVEYAARRRLPRRAFLVIEVSESSLSKDRLIKAPIYGENLAPEYWIVDIPHEVVLVHAKPRRGAYERVAQLGHGDVLRPVALPGVEIAVAEIPWRPRASGKARRRR
jgi:Uma2 family endonuclease